MSLSVVVGSEPDVVVTRSIVLPINDIANDSRIIRHGLQRMYTRWMSVNANRILLA